MTILGALILISVAGVGAVFWLLKNEKEGEKVSSPIRDLETQNFTDQLKGDEKPGRKLSFLSHSLLNLNSVCERLRIFPTC